MIATNRRPGTLLPLSVLTEKDFLVGRETGAQRGIGLDAVVVGRIRRPGICGTKTNIAAGIIVAAVKSTGGRTFTCELDRGGFQCFRRRFAKWNKDAEPAPFAGLAG
jgi:hypothetical protein